MWTCLLWAISPRKWDSPCPIPDKSSWPVTPITVDKDERQEERIQFAFNFHLDVGDQEDPVARIQGMLSRWDAVREEASRIVHTTLRKEPA